jgi:hypothetical protein
MSDCQSTTTKTINATDACYIKVFQTLYLAQRDDENILIILILTTLQLSL